MMINAPLIVEETPQQLTWRPGQSSDGQPTLHMMIQTLMTTSLVIIDKESGLKLRDALTEYFDDSPRLEIAHSIPKANDKPGPLGPFRA